MIKCCNKEIKIQKANTLWWAKCETCGKGLKHKDKSEVEKHFQQPAQQIQQLPAIPKKPQEIIKWGQSYLPALMNQSAQFQEKPATQRMIEKNLRYVSNLSGGSWDKIWNTEAGQESIKDALIEANYYAATLGEMGDIVPFGSIAEFIPSVECFQFALSTGTNAPLKDILITPIHENDTHDNYQKSKNFVFEIKRNLPRGEIIGVAIEATRTLDNITIGTVLDEPFLMQIAKDHSKSYKSYVIDKEDFQRMKVEGKLKKDSTGREYMEKEFNKKNGDTWKKKIYEHDITNTYVTSDKVKMLIKTAGKHYFKPFMKVRNASAMAEEWQTEQPETRDQATDTVLNNAMKQFDGENVTDAEYEVEKQQEPEKEKVVENDNESLFND